MAELGEDLSEREQEVLEQLVQGASNKVIASNLFISPNTVKVHLRNINTKLGASSRTEASRIALEKGLVTIPGMEVVAETEPEADVGDEPAAEQPVSEKMTETVGATTPDKTTQEVQSARSPVWLYALGAVLGLALIGFGIWYFLGQGGATVPTASYEPDPVGDSRWFESRDLPEALSGASSASIGSNVFVIGGQQSDGTVNGDVHVYNSNDHTWWVAEPIPQPVFNASAVTLTGASAFIVVGGETAGNNPINAVQVYDLDGRAWGELAPLPQPMSNGLLLSDGALIYYLGGDDGSGAANVGYVYDPAADRWEELPSMPEARTGATGGLVLGSIYVIGGAGSDGISTSNCFEFSITDSAWSECASMGNSRFNASGEVILNRIYVIGGETSADFGELYNPESDKWEQIPQPMVEGRDSPNWTNSAVSTVDSNKIYVLGGEFNNTLSTDAYFYSPLVYQSFIPSATNE